MVAPNEAAKLAIPSGTPSALVWVCTFIGIEPALVRAVKANASSGRIFLKKRSGLRPTRETSSRCTANMMAMAP